MVSVSPLNLFRAVGSVVSARTFLSRHYSRACKQARSDGLVKNEAITVPEVVLITNDNVRQGPMAPSAILQTLDRRRFDLVLVNPNHSPPLVKALVRTSAHHKTLTASSASIIQRLRQREKEVRFGTSMALHDQGIRLRKVEELLERAYRVRLVVEVKGKGNGNGGAMGRVAAVARETMYRDLMGKLRGRFGKDLTILSPPESLCASLVTVIYSASAKPPSTKPNNGPKDDSAKDDDED